MAMSLVCNPILRKYADVLIASSLSRIWQIISQATVALVFEA
jgi:hypothetical protein